MTPETTAILGLHTLHRRLADKVAAINIDPPLSEKERYVLACLDAPRRLGEIARIVEVLPSTISAAANALERKGYVNRRQDPVDGRAWLLERSAQGQAVAERLETVAAEVFREATGFNKREVGQLARLFARFFEVVDA